jgi:hypothetical protein
MVMHFNVFLEASDVNLSGTVSARTAALFLLAGIIENRL